MAHKPTKKRTPSKSRSSVVEPKRRVKVPAETWPADAAPLSLATGVLDSSPKRRLPSEVLKDAKMRRASGNIARSSERHLPSVAPSAAVVSIPTAASEERKSRALPSRRREEVRDMLDDPRKTVCKERPKDTKSKGGGSRAFVPWCDRK